MQARPLVPRLWKNGLSVSRVPVVEKVLAKPVGLTNGSRGFCALASGSLWPEATHAAAGATSRKAARSRRPAARPAALLPILTDIPPSCSLFRHSDAAEDKAFLSYSRQVSATLARPRGHDPVAACVAMVRHSFRQSETGQERRQATGAAALAAREKRTVVCRLAGVASKRPLCRGSRDTDDLVAHFLDRVR